MRSCPARLRTLYSSSNRRRQSFFGFLEHIQRRSDCGIDMFWLTTTVVCLWLVGDARWEFPVISMIINARVARNKIRGKRKRRRNEPSLVDIDSIIGLDRKRMAWPEYSPLAVKGNCSTTRKKERVSICRTNDYDCHRCRANVDDSIRLPSRCFLSHASFPFLVA